MTEKQLREFRAALKKFRAKHAATPKQARKLLEREGVLTKSGKLAKPYSRKLVKAS